MSLSWNVYDSAIEAIVCFNLPFVTDQYDALNHSVTSNRSIYSGVLGTIS